ncbi:MAG: T9SS type A sorting domain-containing protein [Saprospiraceae bacterium]|nr:T9SS type A sorting domain-containing protein [Saprospiraceae bacterium]
MNPNTTTTILFFLFYTSITILAQETVTFRKTFGDIPHDFDNSVQQTTDGGYILFGLSTDDASFNYDLYLVKTDYKGEKQWEKKYEDESFQYGNSVQQTTDGGYILCGGDNGLENDSVLLMKTNSTGNTLWKKKYRMSIDRIDSSGNSSGVIDPFDNVSITICPNPVFEIAYIKFKEPLYVDYTFLLFDTQGRLIRDEKGQLFQEILFDRNNLAAGVYFFKILSGDSFLGKGKIIVL